MPVATGLPQDSPNEDESTRFLAEQWASVADASSQLFAAIVRFSIGKEEPVQAQRLLALESSAMTIAALAEREVPLRRERDTEVLGVFGAAPDFGPGSAALPPWEMGVRAFVRSSYVLPHLQEMEGAEAFEDGRKCVWHLTNVQILRAMRALRRGSALDEPNDDSLRIIQYAAHPSDELVGVLGHPPSASPVGLMLWTEAARVYESTINKSDIGAKTVHNVVASGLNQSDVPLAALENKEAAYLYSKALSLATFREVSALASPVLAASSRFSNDLLAFASTTARQSSPHVDGGLVN